MKCEIYVPKSLSSVGYSKFSCLYCLLKNCRSFCTTFSRVRSLMQQSEQRYPHLPVLAHFFQFLWKNPKALLGPPKNVGFPTCLSQGLVPVGQNTHGGIQKASGRDARASLAGSSNVKALPHHKLKRELSHPWRKLILTASRPFILTQI